MRTHTTLTLRNLILHDMDPAKHQMSQQDINVWIESIPMISEEMFKTMHMLTSSLFEKRLVRRQIMQIQKECVTLLDASDKLPELRSEMLPLQASLRACLIDILEQIENIYWDYMDKDYRMPQVLVTQEAIHVQESMNMLTAQFASQNVSIELQAAVLHCMKDAVRLRRITYGRMRYVQRLQAVLIELMTTVHKDLEERICDLLNQENYNYKGFTDFYKGWLSKQFEEEKDGNFRISLDHYQRVFRKAPYKKRSIHYDPYATKCHKVMHDFILEEIKTRTPKVEKVFFVRPEPVANSQHRAEKPYKIKTILSVESLAYLVKLMLEAKVIEAGVKTALFEFIASSFETPGTAENGMSAGSFSTKFKNVVQATAKTVRAKLIRMTQIIDEEFI